MQNHALHIKSLSSVDATHLVEQLKARDITISSEKSSSIWLVIVDSIGDPRISTFNHRTRELGKPMVVFKPTGQETEYALFTNDSACWTCFEKKHRLLDGAATYLYSRLNFVEPIVQPEITTTRSLELAFDLITSDLSKILNAGFEGASGKLNCTELNSNQTTQHIISKIPDCPVCGIQENKPKNVLKKLPTYELDTIMVA